MKLVALPAFTDNYIWMLHDGAQAIVVDPGDAAPVSEALDALSLALSGILVTHHHADHVGGLQGLLSRLQGPIWGPAHETMPVPICPVSEPDVLAWNGLILSVLDVPGHTSGHIAFYVSGAELAPLLFCGDTLFSGGCGRLFEGTPAQMWASLQKLNAFEAETQVCCTHEYTLSNLRFALAVEPDNKALQEYTAHCTELRRQGLPTLPSTLAIERLINPFLRCDKPAVWAAAQTQSRDVTNTVSAFAALREWKNQYR
jgi:hydroxyacylglutathione hydrolase